AEAVVETGTGGAEAVARLRVAVPVVPFPVVVTETPATPAVGAAPGDPAWAVPVEPVAVLPPPIWTVPVEPFVVLPPPAIPAGTPAVASCPPLETVAVGLASTPLTCTAPVEPSALLPPPAWTVPVEPEALLPPPDTAAGAETVAPLTRAATWAVTGPVCAAPVEPEAVLPPPVWTVPVEPFVLLVPPAIAAEASTVTFCPPLETDAAGAVWTPLTCAAPVE